MKKHSIKKYLLIALGSLSLLLGMISVFVPVLPTTPFLLLASFCYIKSSKRLYDWLIHHKIFGTYIYCYMHYKAIPKHSKIFSMIFLWTTLSISILLMSSVYIRIFLVTVGVGVTIHLLSLNTLSRDEIETIGEKTHECIQGS